MINIPFTGDIKLSLGETITALFVQSGIYVTLER